MHDPLALGAERVERDPELLAVSLQRLDLHAGEPVIDQPRRRRAVRGHVVVGGGDRPVRTPHGPALDPQPVEGLRRGHLVHEVEVDVEQAVGDLVGVPDLVEQRLGPSAPQRGAARLRFAQPHSSAARGPRRRRRGTRPARSPWFSKRCGRSASKVTVSPAARSWRSSSISSATDPGEHDRRLAGSRLVQRWIARTAGRGAGIEPVQRDVGALTRQRRGQLLGAMAAPAARAPVAGPRDDHVPALVEAQQLRQAEVEPPGDPLGDGERRARLAPLDLRQHRRGDPAALGQVAQREVHPLAQGADPRPDRDPVACDDRAHRPVRYHERLFTPGFRGTARDR